MMTKHGLKTTAAAAMMLIMMVALPSCGMISGAEEASEYLKLVYEGSEAGSFSLETSDGTVETKSHGFIFENTSDKDLSSASVAVHGLDGNGEKLRNSFGSTKLDIPSLKPGERAFIDSMDAEWAETPASYKAEPVSIVWGDCKGVPLTILDVTGNGFGFSWEVTLRNDGDEDLLWINDYGSAEDKTGRQPVLVAVGKDGEGNTTLEQGVLLDGDDIMRDNFTIAPGEEKTVEVCYSESYQDPEIIVCWH